MARAFSARLPAMLVLGSKPPVAAVGAADKPIYDPPAAVVGLSLKDTSASDGLLGRSLFEADCLDGIADIRLLLNVFTL